MTDLRDRRPLRGVRASWQPRTSARAAASLPTDLAEVGAPRLSRLQRGLDLGLAGTLLAISVPVMAAIALTVLLVDGRPVLHRGVRLGYRRRTFAMVKFRTLVPDAAQRLGANLESPAANVRTRTGGFLRDVRLDELPQLWNVLRGEMTFVGPRPERPSVYAAQCADIPNYDLRFTVRPGILGYSQLLTPHGAPKQMRARIDNRFVRRPLSTPRQLLLIVGTVAAMCREALRRGGTTIARALRRSPERRALPRRHATADALAIAAADDLGAPPPPPHALGAIIDIDERALRIRVDGARWSGAPRSLLVRHRDQRRGAGRTRSARCHIQAVTERPGPGGTDVVVWYEPIDDKSRYVIDQYLLDGSLMARPKPAR
ncbi:MAG: sugar transferase [Planctomycetota bacterium]